MSEELTVFIRHVRAANLCTRGGREWFAAHGLSWTDFLENGIPASKLIELGDPMAAKAVEAARSEADGCR